ncbi:MAG: hypothetical protein P8R54_04800 [Myxococcota bacterium]|nr:hypothetical protein [Myxococcota bacterium]
MNRLTDAALHLLLAGLVTLTMLASPLRRLLGSPDVDVWNHAWGPWWFADSFASGQLPWRTALLGWPDGGVLWFIDPVLGVLGAPLVWILGAVGAYNAVVFGYVLFASWAGRRLARSLGASAAASWVGATGLAGSAWMICELHNGISEAVNIGPVALALAWSEDAVRAGSLRGWAKAGLGVGMAAVASPYLGLGVGIAVAVRGLPSIRQAWLGAVVSVMVAAPPILALRTQLHAEDAIVKHPDAMNEQLALHNAVDPRTFVMPFGFRSVDLSAEGFEHSMYLGLVALLLAALVVWRHRWWGLATVACLACALGPYLFWGDGWLVTNGARLRLPWWALQKLAPGLAVTHPLRLAVPALAIIAGLAAVGADRLGRWRGAAAVAVLLDGLLISGAPWPILTADATPPPAHEQIRRAAGEPIQWGVLDLPTDAGMTMATSRYLFWQSTHRLPISYGPDARASTSALLREPSFRVLAALCSRRPDEHARLNLSSGGPGGSHPSRLIRSKIRYIVLHHDIDPAVTEALRAELTGSLGPGAEEAGATMWDLMADQ